MCCYFARHQNAGMFAQSMDSALPFFLNLCFLRLFCLCFDCQKLKFCVKYTVRCTMWIPLLPRCLCLVLDPLGVRLAVVNECFVGMHCCVLVVALLQIVEMLSDLE